MAADREARRSMGLVVGSLLLGVALCQVVFWLLWSIPGVVEWLDDRHPYHMGRMNSVISTTREQWHMMRVNHEGRLIPTTIPIVGSSSVVNGVDAALVTRFLPPGYRAANFGLTSLFAYELPLFKEEILPPGRRYAVLVYNTWMFTPYHDVYQMAYRYHPGEVARELKWWRGNWLTRKRHLVYLFNYYFPLIRYQPLLQRQLYRLLTGDIKVAPYYADYPPTMAPLKSLPTKPESRLGLVGWQRASATAKNNLGWRGLRRFLELARQRKVKILVVPAPSLVDKKVDHYAGVDLGLIERRVAILCKQYGAEYIPRRLLPDIPHTKFLDFAHLHASGRKEFSPWLGQQIAHFMRDGGRGL